jgi:hypothetical protein
VNVEIDEVAGGFHGFETLARRTEAATRLILSGRSWLEVQLGATGPSCSSP